MILRVSVVWVDLILDNGVIRKAESELDIHGMRPFDARPVVHVWRPDISAQIEAEARGLEYSHLGTCWVLRLEPGK